MTKFYPVRILIRDHLAPSTAGVGHEAQHSTAQHSTAQHDGHVYQVRRKELMTFLTGLD